MVCLSLLLGGLALVSKYGSLAALFCVRFGNANPGLLVVLQGAEQFAFAVFLLFFLFAAAAYGLFRHIVS
jgi:hypothetical protein